MLDDMTPTMSVAGAVEFLGMSRVHPLPTGVNRAR
jgi:hypothetical protein